MSVHYRILVLALGFGACGRTVTKEELADTLPEIRSAMNTAFDHEVITTCRGAVDQCGFEVSVGIGPVGHQYDGWTECLTVSCQITIADNIVSPLNMVLMHEIGHSLGLGHSEDPENIMYARSKNKILTDQEMAAQLAAACGNNCVDRIHVYMR